MYKSGQWQTVLRQTDADRVVAFQDGNENLKFTDLTFELLFYGPLKEGM